MIREEDSMQHCKQNFCKFLLHWTIPSNQILYHINNLENKNTVDVVWNSACAYVLVSCKGHDLEYHDEYFTYVYFLVTSWNYNR